MVHICLYVSLLHIDVAFGDGHELYVTNFLFIARGVTHISRWLPSGLIVDMYLLLDIFVSCHLNYFVHLLCFFIQFHVSSSHGQCFLPILNIFGYCFL